jgi:FMN-dependent NADH-azoreductase
MAHVLHVQTSPRGDDSFSIRTARAFLQAYERAHPDDAVETLDLVATPPPEFRGEAAGAKMDVLAGEKPGSTKQKAWSRVCDTIAHFKQAGKLVISTPMWNFGVPYPLKHYIDVIVQPRETFRYTDSGAIGLVTGRPCILILARGGRYAPGTPGEAMDMQRPYLEAILGFIGFGGIRSILIEPTVAEGPEAAEQALAAAFDEAREAAESF